MRPGDVVAERFEIESIAGEGGMGLVFRAIDRVTGRTVALKVIVLHVSGAVERFDREARMLAALDHPGIVRYIAHGVANGQPWLAMEWLEGEELAGRLFRAGLTRTDALKIVRLAAGAVGVAHQQGIVHRDLKPQNLFLLHGDSIRVKVLDFGIARASFGARALTMPGQVLGTPAYMAPEQARGETEVGPTADVWSLGAILYECLAGRTPFVGDFPVAVLMKALVDDPPPLVELVQGTPPALGELVMRMLRRNPDERPADASAVARALFELRLDDEPSPMTTGPSVAPRAITGAEQELIAVVLAMPDLQPRDTLVTASPTHPKPNETLRDVQRLADGSSMIVLRGAGHATDLAARAARAAIALRATMGPGFRLALATGRARLDERVPVGEVVDRAAAMASRSPTGAIMLDELTAGLLPGGFVTRAVDGAVLLEEELSGDETVRTFLGRPTPLVGRKKELRMLGAVADEAFDEHVAQAALLMGPPGCGKTRLRHELVRELGDSDRPIDIWIGRGDPVAAGSSFGVITRALSAAFMIREGDPLEVRRERVRERVARHVPETDRQRVTEFLGELLGSPFDADTSVQLRAARADLQLMGDQLRRAVLDLIAAEAAAHPLLLVVEDLQWGDLPSVSLLETALTRLAELPFMLLATARPQIDERLVAIWRDHGGEQINLSPLPRREAERFARHVLGDGVASTVVERIVERAEGNAFFLEELLRAQVEGRGGELPPTLVAVAQARLDALEPAARRILRAASVTGLAFWPSCVLTILGGQRDTPQLDAWIHSLTHDELFEPRALSRFASEPEHAFRQDIVREAAYRSFTDADRATAHLLAATWLEAVSANDPAAIAGHFERGGRRDRAREHWVRASEQALEGQDLDAARAHAGRAIAAGAEGELLGRAYLAVCEAASWQLDYEPAVEAASEAIARLTPGSAAYFEAAGVAVACTKAMGRHDQAARFVLAVRTAPRTIAPGAAACALATAASHLLYAGDVEGAAETSLAARDVALHCGSDAGVLGKLALLSAREANFRGDTGAYAQQAAAARTLFEAAGDVRRTLNQQSNVGYALLELGRFEEAELELSSALAKANESGNSRVAAFARHNIGMVLAMLGRVDEAREAEQTAVEEFRDGGHARLEAGSRIYLAQILTLAGDLDGALSEARAAVEQLREVAPPLLPMAHATVASIHLTRGETADALVASAEAISTGDGPIEAGESLVRLTRAEALHASGQVQAARVAIAEAEMRLRERAERIHDDAYRRSFLERIPENARTVELSRRWR